MALGDVTRNGCNTTMVLLASATATNSAPSGATAGVAMKSLAVKGVLQQTASIIIASTAGSGTMTAGFRIWGYLAAPAVWVPLGTGTATAKGQINAGVAIEEDEANTLRHAEPISNIFTFDRLYLEIESIGGTNTAVTGWLVVPNDRFEKNWDDSENP